MKGNPRTMNQQAQYDDVFAEVYDYFVDRYHQLKQMGVHDVIIDPGFGFAKKREQSYALMNRYCRILICFNYRYWPSISRKTMIYGLLGITADEALNGTTALNTIALTKGANILRVHDVKEAVK